MTPTRKPYQEARPAFVAVLGLLFVLGCRGQATWPGPGRDPDPADPLVAPSGDLVEGPADDSQTAVSREQRQQRFWAEHGITLRAEADAAWIPLGQPVVVSLVLENRGPKVMTLPMRRRPGLFDDPEQGQVYLDVQEVRWSARWGRRATHRREKVEAPAQLELAPGNELRLQFEVAARADPDTDLIALRVTGWLYPLAVRFEDEPERFVALSFPPCDVHVSASGVCEHWLLGDWSRLEMDPMANPQAILGLAVMYAELDRIRVTDWLIAGLPGRNTLCRSALTLALEEVTGQSLGTSVSKWKSWWDSERGVRWAMKVRAGQEDRGRTP